MSAETVQLKPPRSEELAQMFDRLAAEARRGEVVGFSAILIRPRGEFTTTGWQAKERNAFEEIGMHVAQLLDIWRAALKD